MPYLFIKYFITTKNKKILKPTVQYTSTKTENNKNCIEIY